MDGFVAVGGDDLYLHLAVEDDLLVAESEFLKADQFSRLCKFSMCAAGAYAVEYHVNYDSS